MENVQRVIPFDNKLPTKIEIIGSAALNQPFLATLTNKERKMLYAMTKSPIQAKKQAFIEGLSGRIIERLSVDVGLKDITDVQRRRFVEVALENYGWLSALDFANAFEFAATSELDEYFPRNANGTPYKEHYQSFSTDYVCRVMNAYIRRRGILEGKIYSLKIADAGRAIEAKTSRMPFLIIALLAYKYMGDDSIIQRYPTTLYEKLHKAGLADDFIIKKEDVKQAVARLIKKAYSGAINQFVGDCVRYMQEKHPDVPSESMLIAKTREIRLAFDRIINEEIQITDYIRL